MKHFMVSLAAVLLTATVVAAANVDESPLAVKIVPAFPELKITGWEEDINGKPNPLRPIIVTHFGDGTNRVVMATEQGQIHVFDNKAGAQETKMFLDLSPKVSYKDNENEEGFLGLAFHPKYKENGQFFAYYTAKDTPHTSVVSRFRVSKDDPNKADPTFEEELMRIPQPFWNHNGGTVCFGPDGYLYIVLGDGGAGNDPLGNAQNLQTLLGSILRIDIDNKSEGKPYAIPSDNPFLNEVAAGAGGNKKPLVALPEIYAYGLRNPWRLSFDRSTGTGWIAEVGQNVWEEIDILEKGGNYGWNLREGKHVFNPAGAGIHSNLIDPIWEYDHSVGKSITGGQVYRGKEVPELAGHYLYADYVSGKVWALKYDEKSKTVTANRSIAHSMPSLPVITFGEDEPGEVYFGIVTPTGQGLFKFASGK
ncbi:glucose sorbosone dehydrogenase [bacterium]|nr:glucose sorbosone dehydrogenase [bacterium]